MIEREYVHLIRQLDELLTGFEQSAPREVQEQVGNLLAGVDLLHRQGLARLVEGLRAAGAGDALEQLAAEDRVVGILLGLYDLAPLEIPEVEEAPPPPAAASGFVPLSSLRRATGTEWTEVARAEELLPGAVRARRQDGLQVLLLNVDGEVYAFRGACAGCGESLESAYLVEQDLICPWCAARYDARSGAPRGEGEPRLQPLPVAVEEGSVRLARSLPAAGRGAAP